TAALGAQPPGRDRPDAELAETLEAVVGSLQRGAHDPKDVGDGQTRPDVPRLVHQLANPLVARPRQPQPLRLGTDTTVGLRDRPAPVVEAHDRLDQPSRDPRRHGDHAEIVAPELSRGCDDLAPGLQVTLCYKLSFGS